jgi:hypothetical protein
LSQHYSALDEIVDDQMWKPEAMEAANPDDLAALMAGPHTPRQW